MSEKKITTKLPNEGKENEITDEELEQFESAASHTVLKTNVTQCLLCQVGKVKEKQRSYGKEASVIDGREVGSALKKQYILNVDVQMKILLHDISMVT